MEKLWAPWRSGYITRGAGESCIFCGKTKEKDDAKNHVVARRETCFSMLNLYPYNGGHLMAAPCRHVADLAGLDMRELTDLILLVRDSVELLRRKLSPDGFNIGVNMGKVAGAGVVDHLHVHVVPRWNGDTNFMPVIAGTKVISHSVDEMFSLLTGP